MSALDPFLLAQAVLERYGRSFLQRWGDRSESASPASPFHSDPHVNTRARLADALSAGWAAGPGVWSAPVRLRSIFDRIEPAGSPGRSSFHALRELDPHRETLFPEHPGREGREEEYRALARGLGQALRIVEDLARGHTGARIAGMLGAMARFAWCVPASSEEAFEDISLYDHSRVAAAWAAVLADMPEDLLRSWEAMPRDGSDAPPIALLLKGDLSGIQDFIYRVSGKGTARGLRGRSLYLQLLSEAVALFLLRQLALPLANLLYSSGGHFWILARPTDEGRLAEIQRKIEEHLTAFHGMDLGLVLAAVPLRPADLQPGGLAAPLQRLAEQLRAQKSRRFAGLSPELWADRLLRTQPGTVASGDWTDCSICGQVGRMGYEIHEATQGLRKCRRCLSFEELGRQVLDASAVAWLWLSGDRSPPAHFVTSFSTWVEAIEAFGLRPVLFDSGGRPIGDPSIPSGAQWALVWAVGSRAWDPDIQRQIIRHLKGLPAAFIPRFLLRYAPRVTQEDTEQFRERYEARGEEMPEVGSIRDFEILEGWSEGIQRLGVLRADLDSAGALFSEGLGPRLIFSRMVALSGAISRFFEGYVEALCRQVDPKRGGSGVLYALYSGGDDLFIVGAWDALVEFARTLRRELGAYTGGHPRIGLSAGLTLHQGRESARRMAEIAGEALELAKGYRDPARGREKDALAFLDRVLPWRAGETFEKVDQWRARFVKVIREEEGARGGAGRGRSILFALIRWALRIQRERARYPDGRMIIGPWLWHFPYFLRRWIHLAGERSALRELLEEMRAEWERLSPREQGEQIEMVWGPAARWAELLTRRS